jgi:hypothetical protein
MVATSYATPDDVATLLKVTFSPEDNLQCQMVLDGVSAIFRSRLPSLDTWIATGLVDPALPRFATVQVTKNLIDVTNMNGKSRERVGDYEVTFRDVGASTVDAVDEWLEVLTPALAQSRAFSIRPGGD